MFMNQTSCTARTLKLCSGPIVGLLCAIAQLCLWAQAAAATEKAGKTDVWQVPVSQNLMPHFEEANGRQVLYVDGRPFTVLAVEIPWWDLIYGRYRETETAYDYLYLTGELFAPMYIVNNEKTYPRAVDADGIVHHNAASYDYEPIIEREIAAFRAFLKHIKEVDSQIHTILMIQIENEIAVFGVDRNNPKRWRDHSLLSNKRFAENGFTDDLKFSAWDLSYNWIRRITNAGAAVYPLPFFHNFVGGKVADWMVGGSPGEDVETYLKNCPNIWFIGVNSYFCAEWRPDNSCARPSEASIDELRAPLLRYRVSRNLPAITETNSGANPIASRLAYLAIGEFGAPIFAPWALTVSYPEPYAPYVLPDGTLANGAVAC